jgi:hypothetical protein
VLVFDLPPGSSARGQVPDFLFRHRLVCYPAVPVNFLPCFLLHILAALTLSKARREACFGYAAAERTLNPQQCAYLTAKRRQPRYAKFELIYISILIFTSIGQ